MSNIPTLVQRLRDELAAHGQGAEAEYAPVAARAVEVATADSCRRLADQAGNLLA